MRTLIFSLWDKSRHGQKEKDKSSDPSILSNDEVGLVAGAPEVVNDPDPV
ncbi:hypothetical protein [Pseudoduganella namucuonensis]|nr:hypothetical protein [Pseudoduganella namucuonensis]